MGTNTLLVPKPPVIVRKSPYFRATPRGRRTGPETAPAKGKRPRRAPSYVVPYKQEVGGSIPSPPIPPAGTLSLASYSSPHCMTTRAMPVVEEPPVLLNRRTNRGLPRGRFTLAPSPVTRRHPTRRVLAGLAPSGKRLVKCARMS